MTTLNQIGRQLADQPFFCSFRKGTCAPAARGHTSPLSKRLLNLLVLLGCSLLTFTTGSTAAGQAKPTRAELAATLQTSFGSAVEMVATFDPFFLTGDFNGDGVEDVLIVARIKGRRSEVPGGVQILNPFGYGAKTAYPANPSSQPTLALVIVHGAQTGWKAATGAKFLLLGESPILILQDQRATSRETNDRKSLMELIRRRGRRVRGAMSTPAAARGDVVLLGTEAADSTLYWNGKTYRWVESEDGE